MTDGSVSCGCDRKGTSVCAEGLTKDPTAHEDVEDELQDPNSVMSYSSCKQPAYFQLQ